MGLYRPGRASELPFKSALPYVMVSLMGLMAADLVATYARSLMIPTSAPAGKPRRTPPPPFKSRSDYNNILARNIFNSDGLIPSDGGDTQVADFDTSGPARESTLPLTLVGTIVHGNPGKSVATILPRSGGTDTIMPYIPNDDIEGMATLIKVERKKVFIRNLSSRALEYIEIKDQPAIMFEKAGKPTVSRDGPIVKEGKNTYAISRQDLEAQMQNLPDLLTQARAIPNTLPGGGINGFKIIDIKPNSLFSKLGIVNNDVILGVDGSPVNSPAKAMELYNALRTRNEVKLSVERNGRQQTMNYNIR